MCSQEIDLFLWAGASCMPRVARSGCNWRNRFRIRRLDGCETSIANTKDQASQARVKCPDSVLSLCVRRKSTCSSEKARVACLTWREAVAIGGIVLGYGASTASRSQCPTPRTKQRRRGSTTLTPFCRCVFAGNRPVLQGGRESHSQRGTKRLQLEESF